MAGCDQFLGCRFIIWNNRLVYRSVGNVRKLMNFPYSKVLVLGLGRSGMAVANLLLTSGIEVTVNDRNEDKTEQIKNLIRNGAEVILGSHPASILDGIQLIIKSPGISYDHQLIKLALNMDLPIITDIELIQYVFSGPIIGITGSNGKTTTTRLVEEMFKADDIKCTVAGNIGIPVSEVAPTIPENRKLVLELSSFQLLGIETFKPHISVLLNIYDAHLDYHKTRQNYKQTKLKNIKLLLELPSFQLIRIKTFKPHITVLLNIYDAHLDYHKTRENYEQAKFNIFKNQNNSDYLVYNLDDDTVREAVKQAESILVPFSQIECLEEGVWVKNRKIYFMKEEIIHQDKIVLAGGHHLDNILAAIAVATINGVSKEAIEKTLTSFRGVKHRLQFVDEIKKRRFYNDSKATNMLATIKALQAFDSPIILLAGGLDRGDDFKSLIPYLTNVKSMIVFGENAEKLIKIAKKCSLSVQRVRDVERSEEH